MITIKRCTSENIDFINLVAALDKELAIIDGDDHAFYSQYNKIDKIQYAIVAYKDEVPVGCGAIKQFDADSMEVKRMYVNPNGRNMGTATVMLKGLENWAKESGYKKCLLETGKRQEDAVALYTKNGYVVIPNYGQYEGVENSVCFEKVLG
ncbi:GNAT family N-acetyltransferase [uncultured Arcticibacterium sp.]|uniref:GNAT family N-acetyltransferase n=1 Tax=uncultured Arcticibacterium sp. TaxID=2173042 RepID=UPI0030F57BC2